MLPIIETMECRTLLSASASVIVADLLALKSAATHATSDLKAGVAIETADAKAIKAATAASHPTKLQKKGLAVLQKEVKAGAATYTKKITASVKPATGDADRLVAALKALKARPTMGGLNKVNVDFAALQGVFSNQALAATESATGALFAGIDTDLNTFAAAVPAAQPAVTAAEAHLAGDLTTLSTELTAIQSAVTKLGSDLP